jgi:hypothetical protein
MHGKHYLPPEIVDYGDLRQMTAAAHPLLGVPMAQAPPFSSAAGGGPGGRGAVAGTQAGVLPQQVAGGGTPGESGVAGETTTGGGSPGGGSGGGTGGGTGGGGGGGSLPFTGLVAGAVAATGSALAAAGAGLRRALRR